MTAKVAMKPGLTERCIERDKETMVMDSFSKPSQTYPSATPEHLVQSDLKIALQSALAAGLCLGPPAGLFFWLITMQRWAPSTQVDQLVRFLQDHAVPPVMLEMLGAFGWGLLLGRISGYRQWWWLSLATMAGVRVGGFALYHGWLEQWVQGHASSALPLHVRFGLILGMNVLCVTVSTGLLLGLALKDWKASLVLAAGTGLASVLAALGTLLVLDGLGIRVGSGNAAMPKVTAAATLAAALAGGAVLGVLFSRYVRAGPSK
jgi:hypothetical protein